MKPGVSLAMIVKDDAKRLKRCLESVKEVVAEMIVVDTGSTDGTQEVAVKCGARLIQREWPNAFDVANNWAAEAVETEWTLRLDSDEWLRPYSVEEFRKAVAYDGAFAYNIIRENIDPQGNMSEGYMLRLWRTHPLMRWSGVIHEQLPTEVIDKVAGKRKVFNSHIRIAHDGYAGGLAKEKLLRNLRMIDAELKLRPGQLYYEIERACTLMALADPQAGASVNEIADRLLLLQNEDEPPVSLAGTLLLSSFDLIPEAELRSARTEGLIRLARGWFWNDPSTTWGVAQIEMKRQNLRGAYDALIELERMATTGDHLRLGNYRPVIMREGLWTNLALVAHQLGKRDVAKRNYEKLLAIDPHHPVASQNIKLL